MMDKWLNQIICGDCLEVMRQMPDKCVDLVVTDPPYLINYKTNRRKDKSHEFCSVIQNDDNPELISDYIAECFRIMKDDTAMYMFCSFDKVDFFKQELEKYFTVKNMIIWVKNSHTAGDLEAQFGKQYEIIFLVNKGRALFYGKRITDVWDYRRIVGEQQVHQNQKPEHLIRQCIDKHSKVGQIVFDGFLGSGTTAIAALNTGRFFIGIEKEPKYCEIARERVKQVQRLGPSLF
jgi:site-specific DNA-methyltransferase (adenine-specific)